MTPILSTAAFLPLPGLFHYDTRKIRFKFQRPTADAPSLGWTLLTFARFAAHGGVFTYIERRLEHFFPHLFVFSPKFFDAS
jgi:hypothetical protein